MTSFLNIMKNQVNPDGKHGHFERERIQKINKGLPPKRKFTGRGSREHNFTIMHELKINRNSRWDKEKIAFAIEFCRSFCKEITCPLCGLGKTMITGENV
ncbi:MAG: hypothetical protein M0Q91_05515 [Methanoregula sp.]|jgi:hypothetical protein|nr:hypothetical protein [Methanoregula sp.]